MIASRCDFGGLGIIRSRHRVVKGRSVTTVLFAKGRNQKKRTFIISPLDDRYADKPPLVFWDRMAALCTS